MTLYRRIYQSYILESNNQVKLSNRDSIYLFQKWSNYSNLLYLGISKTNHSALRQCLIYLVTLKTNHSALWQCLLYLVILETNHSVLWLYLGILENNHSILWLYLGILKNNHSILLYFVSCIDIKTLRCSRSTYSAL